MVELSVIMPNFNDSQFLEDSFRSVSSQTFEDIELVFVDDGSTDTSLSIAESLAKSDSRIRIVRHAQNRGTSAALNTGMKSAKADLMTFMGADDLFAPERAQRLVDLSQTASPAVIYSDPIYLTKNARKVEATASKALLRPSGMILGQLLCGRFRFSAGMIAAPKAYFETVGDYDETLRWGEDFEMALRLAEKFRFVFDPVCTYGYRLYEENATNSTKRKDRWLQQGRILEKHLISNYDQQDNKTRRTSFIYLTSCLVASGRWGSVIRHGFTKEAGFRAMVGLPFRALRSKLQE